MASDETIQVTIIDASHAFTGDRIFITVTGDCELGPGLDNLMKSISDVKLIYRVGKVRHYVAKVETYGRDQERYSMTEELEEKLNRADVSELLS